MRNTSIASLVIAIRTPVMHKAHHIALCQDGGHLRNNPICDTNAVLVFGGKGRNDSLEFRVGGIVVLELPKNLKGGIGGEDGTEGGGHCDCGDRVGDVVRTKIDENGGVSGEPLSEVGVGI